MTNSSVLITVTVTDANWDQMEYADMTDTQMTDTGHLMIIGKDDRIESIWAPGAWQRIDIE